ncbi:MAG: ATP-binding protein [Micrococcales bacterium]|nr:ATP-binding protein [Micrococcales bacterium]
MIDIETRDRLRTMRLSGMVDCLDRLSGPGVKTGLTVVEVIKLMTDTEWDRRRNSKLTRLRRAADLAQPAADVADIRVITDRVVDTDLIARMQTGAYIDRAEDLILLGPTGSGKTYIASALGNKACQQHKTVLYLRTADLLDRLAAAERADTRGATLAKLVKINLLILDEWLICPPTVDQVRNLHALIERRTGNGSTIFCSQISPAKWHDQIEEKVMADAIIDRITANAHKMTLTCTDSLRRHFKPIK